MKNNLSKFNKYLNYVNNELHIEKVSCESLAKKFNTPLFCYSANQIEDNFKELDNSFKKINPLICYAVKANYNAQIIKLLSRCGSGADVVSMGEMKQSLKFGISPKKIVFSGVGKTEEEIIYALKKQIKQINVESEEELLEISNLSKSLKQNIDICLRINPNVDANTHEKISTGRYEDKFGIPEKKIGEIFAKFQKNEYLSLRGISVHIGSQIQKIKPFERAFKKIRNHVLTLRKKGFRVDLLDLGGGIGIPYEEKNQVFQINKYADLVEKCFSDLKLEIILEPGRFLVGSSGIILSKVIRKKKGQNKNFLIIDSGMNNLLRPSLYDSRHNIIPVKIVKNVKKKIFDVVGPICETSDSFLKNSKLKDMNKDDLVVICSTGAYGSCMSSNYNLRGTAKEILIKGKSITKT